MIKYYLNMMIKLLVYVQINTVKEKNFSTKLKAELYIKI